MGDTCKGCDGRKVREHTDKDNVMKTIKKTCSRCNGSGLEPGPSKGKGRFRPKPKDPDEVQSHEDMVREFLARHGR